MKLVATWINEVLLLREMAFVKGCLIKLQEFIKGGKKKKKMDKGVLFLLQTSWTSERHSGRSFIKCLKRFKSLMKGMKGVGSLRR